MWCLCLGPMVELHLNEEFDVYQMVWSYRGGAREVQKETWKGDLEEWGTKRSHVMYHTDTIDINAGTHRPAPLFHITEPLTSTPSDFTSAAFVLIETSNNWPSLRPLKIRMRASYRKHERWNVRT